MPREQNAAVLVEVQRHTDQRPHTGIRCCFSTRCMWAPIAPSALPCRASEEAAVLVEVRRHGDQGPYVGGWLVLLHQRRIRRHVRFQAAQRVQAPVQRYRPSVRAPVAGRSALSRINTFPSGLASQAIRDACMQDLRSMSNYQGLIIATCVVP